MLKGKQIHELWIKNPQFVQKAFEQSVVFLDSPTLWPLVLSNPPHFTYTPRSFIWLTGISPSDLIKTTLPLESALPSEVTSFYVPISSRISSWTHSILCCYLINVSLPPAAQAPCWQMHPFPLVCDVLFSGNSCVKLHNNSMNESLSGCILRGCCPNCFG